MNLNTKEALGSLRETVRHLRLSLIEVVALVAALAFIGVVTFYYFAKVQPLQSELDALKARETAAVLQLEKLNSDEQKRQEQSANAEAILASLKSFEINLKPDERGMTEIINEIDGLGKKHGVITGDSTYRVAEADQPADENNPPKQRTNEDKQKIYPALGIDTNVIGEYPNLRQFLADLERTRQFLIINGLSFQGESDRVRREAQKAGKLKTQMSPEAVLVSLKIEMDTYFQSPYKKELNRLAAGASEKTPDKAIEKASAQKTQ